MEQDHFPTEIVEKMGIQGLMGIPIPEEYDGLGKDFISYIIAIKSFPNPSYSSGIGIPIKPCIPIPEEYDGLGKDFISYIIAIHEISKVSAAVGMILSVH